MSERDDAEMKNPTEQELVAAYEARFPSCRLSGHEHAFLAFVHVARSHGVGFGWMRQAIGLAWKTADPLGYIDDDRLIRLHEPDAADRAREEEREAAAAYCLDRADQYETKSPIWVGIADCAEGIAKGEAAASLREGETEDLLERVRQLDGFTRKTPGPRIRQRGAKPGTER